MWGVAVGDGNNDGVIEVYGANADNYVYQFKPTLALPPGEACFIATASYGTDTAKEIYILRKFRDEVLLPNDLGAQFVSLYYTFSPLIADFISRHNVLRTIVREGFVAPIVTILKWSHNLWSKQI